MKAHRQNWRWAHIHSELGSVKWRISTRSYESSVDHVVFVSDDCNQNIRIMFIYCTSTHTHTHTRKVNRKSIESLARLRLKMKFFKTTNKITINNEVNKIKICEWNRQKHWNTQKSKFGWANSNLPTADYFSLWTKRNDSICFGFGVLKKLTTKDYII